MLTRRIASVLAGVVLAFAPVILFATPAAASPCPEGFWCVRDGTIVPATGGGGGTGSDPGSCEAFGRPISCNHPRYGWYAGICDGNARGYVAPSPRSDQPSPSGADADGAWYVYTCVQYSGSGLEFGPLYETDTWYEATHSPEDTVYDALAMLRLDPPDIGLAPEPSGAGLVGLPVWMWTGDVDNTWGQRSEQVTDGPITVTIWAEAAQIEWDMGNGEQRSCRSPGTPYQVEYGNTPSPDCGYDEGYSAPSRDLPGGVYQVTATTTWLVTWETTTGGLQGDLEVTSESTATVRINELQVLIS